jgi:hypothetical protein
MDKSQLAKKPLPCRWVMYYHSPEDKSWSKDSYTKVTTIGKLEDFFALHTAIPDYCLHYGMFFIMREGILPIWEDPKNMNGGCWSYKVPLSQVPAIWRDMTIQLIIEKLSTVPGLINGISISPKRGFSVVKIWNKSSKQSATSLLHATKPALNHSESMYMPFKNK